jgi:hypothetical protein
MDKRVIEHGSEGSTTCIDDSKPVVQKEVTMSEAITDVGDCFALF